jgi:hypothetical protein
MGYELKAARARAQANEDEPLAKQLNNAFKKLDEVHQEILAELLRPTPSIEDTRGKCVCLAPSRACADARLDYVAIWYIRVVVLYCTASPLPAGSVEV